MRPVKSVACSLCGYRFDPSGHPGCASCPAHTNCQMVCCPACGHTFVDPAGSRLAGWVAPLLRRMGLQSGPRGADDPLPKPGVLPLGAEGAEESAAAEIPPGAAGTLLDVPPGAVARVGAILGIPASRREHMEVYGLTAGRWVRVTQHFPVTVVQVDHTELALEEDLARGVVVDEWRGDR